ncbi:MAG: desulfoferrodoxin, partial [Clostridiales bacterium]|nr:desulfoferrodoxin [Clostridiales bacterium]
VEREGDGNHVTVSVGAVPHPMAEDHYIRFVVIAHGSRVYCHRFSPGDEPSARFSVKDNTVPITAYEYCNLHGLWKTDI